MIGRTNCTQKSGSPSEFVNIQMLTNQAEHSNLNGAVLTMSYETYSKQYTWDGSEITFSVPAHVSCTIEFPEVEGYKKPDNITFVAVEGNSRTIEAEYKAELVKVNVSSSNGSAVSGATLTINGKQQTWTGTEIRQLVPFGTQYSVVAGAVDGFGTPSAQTFTAQQTEREVSVLYVESSLVVNILSNQDTDSSISGVKATVSYGSSSVQVSNGQKISLPIGVSVTISFPDVSGYRKPSNITFTHSGGVVTKSGTYECELLTVNVSADQGSVSGYRVTIASSSTTFGTQTTVTGTYKIPFGTSYTISTTSVNGYITPSAITRIASSKSYTASVLYKKKPTVDLSLYNVYGNLINRSTANCYVVREPGQYKFPLVYGNAIKDGQVNSAAYTNNGGLYSHDFVNGAGAKITQPYMNLDGAFNDRVESISVQNQDADGCISNVRIDRYSESIPCIAFDVNEVPIDGANVIISAKSGLSSYNMIWSWHIWLWPHDLSPVEITNSTGVKYNIMPVNLASKYDSDGVHIKNWFYQWGRPMPLLCPSAWNSTTDHTPGSITKASKASNLATGLCYTSTFYYNSSSPSNWFGSKNYYNLWDAACKNTGASDNDTVKTVYDPCPVGWKVPNGKVFSGFNKISMTESEVIFARYTGDTTGIPIPRTKSRGAGNGNIQNVGYYATSAMKDSTYTVSMYISSQTQSPDSKTLQATGQSIRPVQDDLTKIDTI